MRAYEIMEVHGFIQGQPVAGDTLAAQLLTLGSPTVLYHATPENSLAAVLAKGLHLRAKSRRAGEYGRYPQRIYFRVRDPAGMAQELLKHDAASATSVAAYAVLSVAVGGLSDEVRLFRDPEDRNSVYTETGQVAASALSLDSMVHPEPRSLYFAAANRALRQAGFPSFDAADYFALSDDAIMFYVKGKVAPAKLAAANRRLTAASPAFGPLVIQDADGEWGVELVGYLDAG